MLQSITVTPDNPKYHSDGNCLIETATKELIRGCRDSVIPNDGSVTVIAGYAFSGLDELTSIYIPGSIKTIRGYAFYNCANLETLILCKTLEAVDLNSFTGCQKLNTVYFEGTAAEWNKIKIPVSAGGGGMSFGDNHDLLNADRYYYSEEQPTGSGKNWH